MRQKASIILIIIAAVLVEITSIVQYLYAQEGIQEDVAHRAQSELRVKSLKIQNVMNEVEVAVREMAWAVERDIARPDSMLPVTLRLLADNDIIVGSAVAFEPYYYKDRGRQFSPYSFREGKHIYCKQLGTDQYDYHHMEWYTVPMQTGKGHWSEPYYDKGGGEMMMSTYSLPIRDKSGKAVAVLTADVSLDWLSKVINADQIYPSSKNLIISRTGKLLAYPVESLVMHSSVQHVTKDFEDTTAHFVNSQMMAGKSGQAEVRDNNGELYYVFYTPISLSNDSSYISSGGVDDSGWSMAVVCPDREIYYGLRKVLFNLTLLMLFGLALMGFIVWRTAKAAGRLAQINEEKERMRNDLRVASNIQKGMLPKSFPPFPERDDVDVYGSLVPAKEVGGDLYDFYIRDEKLFFCIGDVSGKGVPASLVMAVTRSLFRTVSAHEAMPDRILTTMNDSMTEMNETSMFVTFFAGVLDLPTGRLRYSNAGHCPPVINGNNNSVIPSVVEGSLHVGRDDMGPVDIPVDANIPLGVMKDWHYTLQEVQIEPPATIFLYTDGLTEAEDSHHAQFGEERMKQVINENETLRYENENGIPSELCATVTAAVEKFVNGAQQHDDLTMLAIRYTKQHRDMRLLRNLTLPNDVQAVPQLSDFIEKVCAALDIDDYTATQINLAMEEAVVNVMKYAYPVGTHGDIDIEAQADDVRLRFTITDSGKPFDPTARKEVDTTLSAEERPIGGLGIHLVRQIMDSMNYERLNGKNILTLRKKI